MVNWARMDRRGWTRDGPIGIGVAGSDRPGRVWDDMVGFGLVVQASKGMVGIECRDALRQRGERQAGSV